MPKFVLIASLLSAAAPLSGQSLGAAGALRGKVVDASGAPVPAAVVRLSNSLTQYTGQTLTSPSGEYALNGIPLRAYRLHVEFPGFLPYDAEVELRTSVPVHLEIRLDVAGQQTSVNVESSRAELIERNTSSSASIDRLLIAELPLVTPDSGLNDAITMTTAGVAADSNGFFHPLGDHAQVSYVLDGQPISDQRNKVFSTSIPANAIQAMEIISGSPAAEFGDKTSLVVNATTRSGLGGKTTGSWLAEYGSFGTVGEEATLATGTSRFGNFIAANAQRSGRFLDTPEFHPMHAAGNTGTLFDRMDFQPRPGDALHLNLMLARNWMQVPNTYDQSQQDQKQKVVSFNIAPGYQHTIGRETLLTANAFFRRDLVDFYPSRNPLDDSPATIAQDRTLTNYGIHGDIARLHGRHNAKAGLNASETRLYESFRLGITDPGYNAPCSVAGTPASLVDPSQCAALGLQPNPDFSKGVAAFDLTRGGRPFAFSDRATIRQLALFGQDTITLGPFTLSLGIRFDLYNGLTRGNALQPRAAFSYRIAATRTVIRGGYSQTMETPTTENLVVSSSTGEGGLANSLFQGTAQQKPIELGRRNQYDAGIQQSLGRWALIDVSYFRKYTRNAYDFDALFGTPVTFPIGWKQSKLDGISARITTVDLHGLRVYTTMGHANARFFGPENGGILFNSGLSVGAYRQDHDQVYQQNLSLHYQKKNSPWWVAFTWRYDSGLVVGAVSTMQDALALTADQQTMIGLYCGSEHASLTHRITSCNSPDQGATRVRIPAPGTANDDHNPPRGTPRNIFSASAGTDNLFRAERIRTMVRFTVVNLTNEAALYNFLSPFGGTHWVGPRTYRAQLGWAF